MEHSKHPRSSSRTLTAFQSEIQKPHNKQKVDQRPVGRPEDLTPQPTIPRRSRKRKINLFATADLTKQSALSLSASDDEAEDNPPATSTQEPVQREIRGSLMSALWGESGFELGQALAVDISEPERIIQQHPGNPASKSSVPRRVSSRLLTYLDDRSTETLTQHDDLITAFPRTPQYSSLREASARRSLLSAPR